METKISVLMPSLNVAGYIEKCMDSVINQTMEDIEIICIDAGSTDGTLEILERYARNDARVSIINADRKSYGYQINLGISKAQGKYIGIVETDDVAELDMFETLSEYMYAADIDYIKGNAVQFFESNGTEKVLSMHIPYSRLNDKGIKSVEVMPCENSDIFVSDNFIWNGIYRRDFLKNISFRETQGAAFQDISALFRIISSAKRAVYVNKCVYRYRQDNMSASSYAKKCFLYLDSEYSYIINMCLAQLEFEWVKTCYWKIVWITLIKFEEMVSSGEYWMESGEALERLKDKIVYAIKNRILSPNDYREEQLAEIREFVESPENLYHRKKEERIQKAREVHEIAKKLSKTDSIIIFGSGRWGAFLADMLYIHYGIETSAFWDNDIEKWGSVVNGIPVCEPKADGIYGAKYVIANKDHADRIRKQLIGMGLPENMIFVYKTRALDKNLYKAYGCFKQLKAYNNI